MNNYLVYAHISPSNKYYVGITCRETQDRWGSNGSGYSGHKVFYRAIKKYGWDNIRHVILATNLTKEQAVKLEKFFIVKYQANNPKLGYNCTDGGEGISGYKHTQQTKQLLKEFWNMPEQIQFARERATGHVTPPQVRQKISESVKRSMTEERRQQLRQQTKGRKQTEETKEKLRQLNLGKKMSEESKRKMSEASKGKKRHTQPHTEQAKKKIGEASRGRHVSQETREKLRLRALQQWHRQKQPKEEI